MWMARQDAAQQWFPASHFLDLCALRRHQPVIEHDAFVALAHEVSGGVISHYHYPPYLLDKDEQTAFSDMQILSNLVLCCVEDTTGVLLRTTEVRCGLPA